MADPTFSWVELDSLTPNPWNPNAMDDEMFQKAIESIHAFGFVDPVTVREVASGSFQIIDGEHRWRAGRDHSGACRKDDHVGLTEIPITNLGDITDDVAKQLTIVLNETRGKYDPKRMGALLTDLVALKPLPELLVVLPFTKPEFEQLAELPTVDWNHVPVPAPAGRRAERWVERVYRLPAAAADRLDEAVREARDTDSTPEWQSLQTIAEHFLGS